MHAYWGDARPIDSVAGATAGIRDVVCCRFVDHRACIVVQASVGNVVHHFCEMARVSAVVANLNTYTVQHSLVTASQVEYIADVPRRLVMLAMKVSLLAHWYEQVETQ